MWLFLRRFHRRSLQGFPRLSHRVCGARVFVTEGDTGSRCVKHISLRVFSKSHTKTMKNSAFVRHFDSEINLAGSVGLESFESFCAVQACLEDRRCWLDSGYMLLRQCTEPFDRISHFFYVSVDLRFLRSILGLVVRFNSGCMFIRQSRFPLDISRFAWLDSGYTSCVSPGGLRTKSLYYPREDGPRILRSILCVSSRRLFGRISHTFQCEGERRTSTCPSNLAVTCSVSSPEECRKLDFPRVFWTYLAVTCLVSASAEEYWRTVRSLETQDTSEQQCGGRSSGSALAQRRHTTQLM